MLGLADAVETALGPLDPTDTDTRDRHTGEITEGLGGVRADVRERLWEPPTIIGKTQLTPDQVVRVLAIVDAVRIAADLHGYGEYTDDLPGLIVVINHAVPSGEWARASDRVSSLGSGRVSDRTGRLSQMHKH